MGRRVIYECDLCGKPTDGKPHEDHNQQALKELLGEPELEIICDDCVARSRALLSELFLDPPRELTFKTFVREIFG